MHKTHTFHFDYALENPLKAIKSFFKPSEIISAKIIATREFPEIALEISTKNAYKKFASFYLNKPLSEINDDDISEIKFYEI